MIKTFFDLDVYKLSTDFAIQIFHITKSFPKEERYSLSDQIIRSSRSICANIAEGWGRKIYENDFKKFLVYAMGSAQETKTWLHFAVQCAYITSETYEILMNDADIIGAKLFKLHQIWKSNN